MSIFQKTNRHVRMSTLKDVFENTKTKHRRNFIQENMRQLREMQNYWKNEQITSMPKGKKFRNVSVPPRVNATQSKVSDKSNKDTFSKEGESNKPLESSHSSTFEHVTQVGIKKKNPAPGNKKNDVIRKGDIAEFARRQRTSIKQVPSSTELSLDMSEFSSAGSDRSAPRTAASRSMGCQTIDPKNLDKLYNEGVIKYPSSRKLPKTKLSNVGKRPPTREIALQTEGSMTQSNRSNKLRSDTSAAGDTPLSNESTRSDLNKSPKDTGSSMDEQKTETDYVKANAKAIQLKQRSPTTASSDPLKPPTGYQRGVLPKYLRDRREGWQKEAEEQAKNVVDPTCPTGHVPLPDSERKETLRMLRKSYADLVQELNMMPVRTDTLRMRHRKMELERQLNKIEEGIKVFSRPKVYVKIGA